MAVTIVELAQRGWQAVADVDRAFVPGELTLVERAESPIAPPGWVGVVALGDSCLAIAPTAAGLRLVSEAARRTRLTELPHFAWSAFGANVVLGPARLYFGGAVESPSASVKATTAGDERVARLVARVSPADAREASVHEISSPAFVIGEGSEVVAIAGYKLWPGELAHVCVLTAPDHRRRGLARMVAVAAARHATDAGLLVQWRARPRPSQLLAESLGLVHVGAQVSFQMTG